ncbi:MAG: MFS transporter [Syntrophales bacterium]|nr:MFS transporter [Syntrophales bacterium]
MSRQPKLFTYEFLALNLILAATFANVSVFYSFFHYLGAIDIPVAWRGILVGLEPMTAFALRLFVIPWLHVRNAYLVMAAGLVLMIATSCSYLWAVSVPALIILRIIHGAVFVLLTSAVIALIVQFIPREKSGQGFSTVSVSTMIPYALIPPLTEALLPYVDSEATIYAGVSIGSLAALILLAIFFKRFRKVLANMDEALIRRPHLAEIRENFRQRAVVVLLAASLLVYLAHATVFYFVKDLALQMGIGNVGIFFTVSMITMIAVRAFGGVLFDRINKMRLLQGGITAIVLTFLFLPQAVSGLLYCILAGIYGLSMGIVLPVLSALLFTASPPTLRGLNTNMAMFALDAGYFIMPYIGGAMVASGMRFDALFYSGAGFAAVALCITYLARRNFR